MNQPTDLIREHSFHAVFPFSVWATRPDGTGTFVGHVEPGQTITVPDCRHWRVAVRISTDEEFTRCVASLAACDAPEISITCAQDRFVSMLGGEGVLKNGLGRLGTLSLTGNLISNHWAGHAHLLDGLTRLCLTECDGITDSSLSLLRRLPQLRKLVIGKCGGLKQPLVPGPHTLESVSFIECDDLTHVVLQDLPALSDLFVWDCGRLGSLRLDRCSALELAEFGAVQLTDDALADVCLSSRLRALRLSDTAVGDGAIAQLTRAPRLETLVLATNPKITRQGLSLLGSLSSLRVLYLETTGAMDAAELEALTVPEGLERLHLGRVALSDATLPLLKKFAGAKGFRLEECQGLTPNLRERLTQDWPECLSLGDTIVLTHTRPSAKVPKG
jgi:hypothetical protein